MAREVLHKEKLEEERRLDAENARQARLDKLAAQEEAIRDCEQERINAEREKSNRVARDMALLQNAEYVRSKREFIIRNIETDMDQKRLVKDQRDKEQNDRVQLVNDYRERQKQLRKEENEAKLQRARDDKMKHETAKQNELLQQVSEAEEKRERIRKEMKAKYEQTLGSSEAASREKIQHIRASTQEKLDERVSTLLVCT
jgi:hypothetical protein